MSVPAQQKVYKCIVGRVRGFDLESRQTEVVEE